MQDKKWFINKTMAHLEHSSGGVVRLGHVFDLLLQPGDALQELIVLRSLVLQRDLGLAQLVQGQLKLGLQVFCFFLMSVKIYVLYLLNLKLLSCLLFV